MADTNFILEHEILKVLYIRTSFHQAGYPMGNGKTVVMAKRDYKDAILYFGTLVDILNCPDKYDDNALKALQGMNRMMEEINTEKYNYQQVSNAIELLEYNGQVVDNIIENIPGKQNGSRRIILTKKGAIDYRDNFYSKKKQNEGLDIKIKKLTISNTKITRGIAIAALIVSAIVAGVTIIKYFDEKNSKKELPIKQSQVERELEIDKLSKENLKEYQQNTFRSDTSGNKVKIVK